MNTHRRHRPFRWRLMGTLALLVLGIPPLATATGEPEPKLERHLRENGWVIDSIQVAEGSRPGTKLWCHSSLAAKRTPMTANTRK